MNPASSSLTKRLTSALWALLAVVSLSIQSARADDLGIPDAFQKPTKATPFEGVVTRNGRFTEEDLAKLRSLHVFASEGASETSFRLIRGVVVVQPESDISVETKFGDVKILRGSIALLALMEDCLAILDLHQSKTAGVKLIADKRVYPMLTGRQFVIAPPHFDYFDQLPKEFREVAHTEAISVKLDDGKTLFCGDFSILSALKIIPPLNRMVASSNVKDRVAVNKMIKNSVILTAISPGLSYYNE